MKGLLLRFWDVQGGMLSSLALLSALFLGGVVAGTVASSNVAPDSELRNYISGYLASAQSESSSAFILPALFNAFKYHFLIVVFGFTALGVVAVPIIVFLRGFFLSFAVTSFVKVLGSGGYLLTLGIFGLPFLIALPCLLILGAQAFSLAISATRGASLRKVNTQFIARIAVCAAALVLSALIEAFLTPHLITAVADIIW